MQQQQMDPSGQAALAAQAAAYQQHHLATMAIQQANAANSAGLLGDYAALAAAGLDATGEWSVGTCQRLLLPTDIPTGQSGSLLSSC